MDVATFQSELQQYRVVRKKNHCRIAWNDRANIASGTPTPAISESAAVESTIVTDASNKPFLPELEQYLTQFFAPTDAATISRQYFRETQKLYVSNMSLDDVEELCRTIEH